MGLIGRACINACTLQNTAFCRDVEFNSTSNYSHSETEMCLYSMSDSAHLSSNRDDVGQAGDEECTINYIVQYIACSLGWLEMVQLFIEIGMNVDACSVT